MHKRMLSHIDTSTRGCDNVELYENVYKIEFCELESDYHMNIYEIHYICKYKPKYNLEYQSINVNLFNIPELNWNVYILNKYVQKVSANSLMRNGKEGLSIKEIDQKLKVDIDFYNSFVKHYLESSFVNNIFNKI